MNDITLILLSAGSSRRFKAPFKKHWLRTGDTPLWVKTLKSFEEITKFIKIILVSSPEDIDIMKNYIDVDFIKGGKTRTDSVSNALKEVGSQYVLISDIARCCLDKDMILRVIKNRKKNSCVVPYLKAADTIYLKDEPVNRDEIKIIQTPQLSCTDTLKKALYLKRDWSDESSAIKHYNGNIIFTEGSNTMHKLTTVDDLKKLICLEKPNQHSFIGLGVDIHKFQDDKKMFLGGVEIEDITYGFKAHSDGDILIHSVIDALLGASGLGDIGDFFPDTSTEYKNIDSVLLLNKSIQLVNNIGFKLINLDLTIIAEVPKISPYKEKIKKNLSKILNIQSNFINIKATTSEKLGFVGKKEGVIVESIANLKYFNWKDINNV